MGLISAIIGWLQYHLGLRTDAASSSGSLHGKMAELRTYLYSNISLVQKPRTTQVKGSFSTTSSTFVTALSITGKGRLVILQGYSSSNASWIKIIVDGTTTIYSTIPNSSTMLYPSRDFYLHSGGEGEAFATPENGGAHYNMPPISYKSSLQIQLQASQSPLASPVIYWVYEKE